MRTRAGTFLLGLCMVTLSVVSCRGHADVEQVDQVAQPAWADPQSPHDFSGLDPAAHVLPATARDRLPGAGEVNPDGSYHYSLPLELPPGRGDVTPKLSLEYSSRSGNGPLGVGWALGGLSAIHPCDDIIGAFGTDIPDEDADERMAFEGDDLCLDGLRLDFYGTPTGNPYTTEQDMSAKIVRLPSHPTFAWKVYLKDHRIRYYYKAASSVSAPVTYPLAEEHDRSGNFTRYHYTNTSPRLIDKIEYTFHSDGTTARREIDFIWTERPDKIKRRVSGEDLRWDLRLTSIAMKAPNPRTKQTVWTYTLGYEESPETGYSRLASVKRCAATGGCSYAREFDWSSRPDRFRELSKRVNPGFSILDRSPLLVFDFTGDGNDDLLYTLADGRTVVAFGGSDRFNDPLQGLIGALYEIPELRFLEYARPVDIDGDGAVELVTLEIDDDLVPEADTQAKLQAAIHYVVRRWNEDAQEFVEDTSVPLPPEVATPAYDAFLDVRCGEDGPRCDPFFFIDANGDGLADIIKARDLDLNRLYDPDQWEIYLNHFGDFRDEHGFVRPGVDPVGLAGGEMLTFSETRYATIHDGRQFLRFARHFPNIPGTPMNVQMIGLRAHDWPLIIDVDNDRPAGKINVSETDSDGDGVREFRWGTPDDPWQAPRFEVLYADVDRDGREDAVVHDTEAHAVEIHLSRTLADSPQPVYVLDQVLEHDRDLAKVAIGDFDGDARPDIVAVESGSDGHLVHWRHHDEIGRYDLIAAHTDHLIHVRDEEHATPLETIWYRNDAPIRNIGEPTFVFEPNMELPPEGSGCTALAYPVVCMKRGMPVVMRHQILAPHAGDATAMRTIGYSYFHPYADAHGRGFLGFRMIRTWEIEQAIETEVWFPRNTLRIRGRYPFAFVPEETQITTLIHDVVPLGRNGYWSNGTARVKRIFNRHEARELYNGTSYLLLNELTEEYEWEEPVEIETWSLPDNDVTNHIKAVNRMNDGWDGTPYRHHVTDPTYDNYGNVIEQRATTIGGVVSEFTMTYKPADTEAWLVDLPADYRYRSWTPSLHAQPQMRHVRYEHDSLGRLTTQWNEPTNRDDDIRQKIEYQRDPAYGKYGQITGVLRTAPGAAGGTRFDGVDWRDRTGEQIFPVQTWNGLSHTTMRVHHPAYGFVIAEADPNDVVTLTTYDDLGRVRAIDPEAGEAVTMLYEEIGETQRITTIAESTARRTTTYDRLGRPIEQTVLGMDGVPDVSLISYDVLGHVYQISNWGEAVPSTLNTSSTYDTLGRVRVVTRPDGSEVESTYPGLFETIHFDAKRARRRVIRDKDQRVIEMYADVEGVEQKSSIVYKPFDLPGFMTDAGGNQIELHYDQLGRKNKEDNPNTGYATRNYNGFGELRRDQRGSDVTVYHRDVLGRVTSMDTVDGVVSFDYDDAPSGFAKGKMWSETSADGTLVTYRFDSAARPRGATWTTSTGESFDVDVERDALGRVVKTLYPAVGGNRLVIENDFEGAYIESVLDATDPAAKKPLWTVTDRTPDGALRTAEYGDAVAYFEADYDAMGQPRRIQAYRTPSSSPLADLRYTPDANGNIERREDAVEGRVEDFTYDELNRLRTWSNTRGATSMAREYRYDVIGNIKAVLDGSTVVEEYTYLGAAGPQKLASSTGVDLYEYDERGRQTRRGNRKITYTAFDQPRTVMQDTSISTMEYEYTASGERVRKAGWVHEDIFIDHLYERHTVFSSTTHVQHVYGPDGAVADIVDDHTGRHVTYIVGDAIGSTTVRFDATSVLDRRHFDPWGKRVHADGATYGGSWSEARIGFTGVEHNDFGLINMGGRLYDPVQRRFISPDPLVVSPYFDQAWNRYSYAYNNPTTLTDPTGYYVSPAWLCGYDLSFFQLSSVSHVPGSGGPPPGQWTRTSPDVTRTSYQSSASLSDGPQFSGPGYANGQPVARWLIDNGVDAWLQENGDTAIKVSLGISFAAVTGATLGMAAEAGVFVGAGEKLLAMGATSWRTIMGVSGVIGEGVRRYGGQLTRWGAQISSAFSSSGTAARGAEIAGSRAARVTPFNPSGSMTNCVNGVCAFLNSVKNGRLVTASADVAWNGGSIARANEQIIGATGVRIGAYFQSNALNTARDLQFYIVYPGTSSRMAQHVLIGINNGGRTMLYDPQTGTRFYDIRSYGPFVAFPVAF